MEVALGEHRLVITDRLWQPMALLLPGKAADRGVTARDNRLFLEAVLTEGAHRRPLARSGGWFRPMEPPVPPLSTVGNQSRDRLTRKVVARVAPWIRGPTLLASR